VNGYIIEQNKIDGCKQDHELTEGECEKFAETYEDGEDGDYEFKTVKKDNRPKGCFVNPNITKVVYNKHPVGQAMPNSNFNVICRTQGSTHSHSSSTPSGAPDTHTEPKTETINDTETDTITDTKTDPIPISQPNVPTKTKKLMCKLHKQLMRARNNPDLLL
jgi:hypothetical protein